MEYRTAGESHGRALVAVVSGVPAGVPLSLEDIDRDLARRQVGYGRGGRMSIEFDRVEVLSGVRFGETLGSPVALSVENRDWENWAAVMAVSGERTGDRRVTAPRPGHADLSGSWRSSADDVRDVLERASARETAARVAAGGVAKAFLAAVGVSVCSWVERIGAESCGPFEPGGLDIGAVEGSDLRCPDGDAAERMRRAIDGAREDGESLGGVFAVAAMGLVPGLGSYAERSRGIDARLAGAVMSIPAIKGVEIGDGFAAAARRGSEVHDPIVRTGAGRIGRVSNHAGGVEGGMTNGEALVLRGAMKPIPTLMKPLPTVDLVTGEPADAARERSDVCAVPAAGVVAEAEVAMVLADAYVRAFGDTCVGDIRAAIGHYLGRIAQ